MRGVILGIFRRIHLLLWTGPSFVAQWGGCFMSSYTYMSSNLRCVVAFISTVCRWILFVLLGDERRWLWSEARNCVPWCPMPFRQRSFAIVSLRHISTSRSALPSAVEFMYVRTCVKQHSCLIMFTVQKTDMFLAGFVIILYHSPSLQIKRFYLVLFWRARCAVYEITENLREDATTCYPTPKTVQCNTPHIRKSCF